MNDVCIRGVHAAADLVEVARTLGEAGVGLEGGGMWEGVAHYLVRDGDAAARALSTGGFDDVEVRQAVLVALDADVPGALARLITRLSVAGVLLYAQYSDHDNLKVLVVDDPVAARAALGETESAPLSGAPSGPRRPGGSPRR